jgi:hypothetical protein
VEGCETEVVASDLRELGLSAVLVMIHNIVQSRNQGEEVDWHETEHEHDGGGGLRG